MTTGLDDRVTDRVAHASRLLLAGLLLACTLTMVLGYANKARCTGPEFDAQGRSTAFVERQNRDVCYSDVQLLWIGRDIDNHVFPYLSGGITDDGVLTGGTVEYPVLSGVLMWVGALGAETDAQFLLQSFLLMAPFGLLVAWALGRLAGRRAFLWAASPPLVLYAVQNWELPVVACAVGAVWLLARWRVDLRRRATWAAVLLAVGFCLKLYPGAFVLPLALHVLTSSGQGRGRLDWPGAGRVVGAATATVVAVNLPFAVLGPAGWLAAFEFQGRRLVDVSTNSIWFWGLRPAMDRGAPDAEDTFQALVGVLSPTLVLVSFAVALAVGWRRWTREGVYPWVPVSAAMLCGFLLFHKVHSPQYTLWLLPFLVLVRVPWGVVAGYLVADLAMGIGIFRYFALLVTAANQDGSVVLDPEASTPLVDGLTAQSVVIGVWGRAALLVALFVLFLRAGAVHEEVAVPGVRAPSARSTAGRTAARPSR